MNLATGIILLILIGIVFLVLRKMIRDKKAGNGCCGSCGSCKGCHGAGSSLMDTIDNKQ